MRNKQETMKLLSTVLDGLGWANGQDNFFNHPLEICISDRSK